MLTATLARVQYTNEREREVQRTIHTHARGRAAGTSRSSEVVALVTSRVRAVVAAEGDQVNKRLQVQMVMVMVMVS